MPNRRATCRACGKPILFAAVTNKEGRPPSPMPLNPDPDPDGNVAVYKDVTGALTGRVVGKGGDHQGYERIMMPHFATCEKKTEPEQPIQPPAGVVFLDAYRKAQAAHNKAKRNQRGKRPAKPITGYPHRPRKELAMPYAKLSREHRYATVEVEVEVGIDDLVENGWHHEDDCPEIAGPVINGHEQLAEAVRSLHRQAHPSQNPEPAICREEPCRSLPASVLLPTMSSR